VSPTNSGITLNSKTGKNLQHNSIRSVLMQLTITKGQKRLAN